VRECALINRPDKPPRCGSRAYADLAEVGGIGEERSFLPAEEDKSTVGPQLSAEDIEKLGKSYGLLTPTLLSSVWKSNPLDPARRMSRPLWRLFPTKWTNAAIEHGYRSRLTDAIEIANFQTKGLLTGLDDHELRPVGFVVNCPVVYRVN
jgi:hypothetical protein